jgi:hypothetical protein
MASKVDALAPLTKEIEVVQDFIRASEAVAPTASQTVEHHATTLKAKILNWAGNLSHADGALLTSTFDKELWKPELCAQLVEAVNVAVTTEPASPQQNSTQLMLSPDEYLPDSILKMTTDLKISLNEKFGRVADWLIDIGAPNPSEKSRQCLIALLARISGEFDHLTEQQFHKIFNEFKGILEGIRSRRSSLQESLPLRIWKFPSTIAEFRRLYPETYDRIYKNDPPAGIQCKTLLQDAKKVRARKFKENSQEVIAHLLQSMKANKAQTGGLLQHLPEKLQLEFLSRSSSGPSTGLAALTLPATPTRPSSRPSDGLAALTLPGFNTETPESAEECYLTEQALSLNHIEQYGHVIANNIVIITIIFTIIVPITITRGIAITTGAK